MVDFADIGRADPVGTIQGWQERESNLATAQQNRAVTDLNIERTKQVMGDEGRKRDLQIQEQKKLDEPVPWEITSMKFEGGMNPGSPGEFITKIAMQNGLIDTSRGGAGTTSKRQNQELTRILSDPQMINKLTRVRIDYGRAQFDQAQQALQAKPDDQKAQQAFQQAETYYRQVTADAKGFEDLFTKVKQTQDQYGLNFIREAEQRYIEQGLDPVEAKQRAMTDFQRTKRASKFAPKPAVVQTFGDVKKKTKEKTVAQDYADWTGANAKEEALKIAKNQSPELWPDMSPEEKNTNTRIVLDSKIKLVEPDAKYGIDSKTKIKGWYIEGEDGKLELVQRWSE